MRISTPLCRRKIAANNLSMDACHVVISAQFRLLMFVEFRFSGQCADISLECKRKDGSYYVTSAEFSLEPCSPFMLLLCQAHRKKNDLNFHSITCFREINLRCTYLVGLSQKFLNR